MQITRILAQRENRKTRIAVYCRVSTKLEEQEESLETQRAAYTDLISLRSDWELVGIYSDSLSGLSAEKRPEFMRMINDALEGKIDRILCKRSC
jgi:site-specific DNA recombinase